MPPGFFFLGYVLLRDCTAEEGEVLAGFFPHLSAKPQLAGREALCVTASSAHVRKWPLQPQKYAPNLFSEVGNTDKFCSASKCHKITETARVEETFVAIQ